jgi:hypothetical protein
MASYLTPYRWPTLQPGRGALIWGDGLRELTAAAAAWGAARGKVLVVDAANRFDPYGLVREARARGLSPKEALSRVQVARAFTSHQLVRLVKEELLGKLQPGCLVLVLGPVTLFYDEQVPLAERRRLFEEMVRLLAAVKAQAPLLLLQPRLSKDAPNRHFGRLLAPVMDYWVETGGSGRIWGEGQGARLPALPKPPTQPFKWAGEGRAVDPVPRAIYGGSETMLSPQPQKETLK